MSVPLVHIQSLLANYFKGSICSAVKFSQAFDERLLTTMDLATWECSNQSKLATELPFGVFGTIKAKNDNRAELILQLAPGYPADVQFPEVCGKLTNAGGGLQSALVCTKVVPVDATPLVGEGIWSCKITPIDSVHGIRVTIKSAILQSDGQQKAYIERVVGETTSEIHTSAVNADRGLDVITSDVQPIGGGNFVKETVRVQGATWPIMVGSSWDPELQAQVVRSEQEVDPPTDFSDVETEFHIVNADRSTKVTEIAPVAALSSLHHVFPSWAQCQTPNVLNSVEVIVCRNLSNGNSVGVGSSASLANSSSIAVAADLIYDITEGYSGSVPSEIHVFYLPLGFSSADVLAAVNAFAWPQFKPSIHRLVLAGRSQSQHVQLSASESGQATSESSEVGAFTNSIVIPACLHEDIAITVTYKDFTAPTGLADEIMDSYLARFEARVALQETALAAGAKMFGLDTNVPESATPDYSPRSSVQQNSSEPCTPNFRLFSG